MPQRVRVNDTAFLILEYCNGQNSLHRIGRRVSALCGADPATALLDVAACVAEFERRGYVTFGPAHTEPGPPRLASAYLSLTARCNLLCRFCYAKAGRPLENELTAEEWRGVVDEVAELSRCQERPATVVLTGGEPLLAPGFRTVAEHAGRLGLPLVLYTNGTLVDDCAAGLIADLGFAYVGVPLDGARAETHDHLRGVPGGFERALAGLRRLVDRGVRGATWQTVVCRHNFAELPLILDAARRIGVRRLQFGPVDGLGLAAEAAARGALELSPDQEAQLHEFVVRANQDPSLGLRVSHPVFEGQGNGADASPPMGMCGFTHSCHVTPRGEVTQCPVLWAAPFVVGDVRRQRLAALWRDDRAWPLRHRSVEALEECGRCGLRNLCNAGCRVNAYNQSGRWDGCERHRREVIQRLVERADER